MRVVGSSFRARSSEAGVVVGVERLERLGLSLLVAFDGGVGRAAGERSEEDFAPPFESLFDGRLGAGVVGADVSWDGFADDSRGFFEATAGTITSVGVGAVLRGVGLGVGDGVGLGVGVAFGLVLASAPADGSATSGALVAGETLVAIGT